MSRKEKKDLSWAAGDFNKAVVIRELAVNQFRWRDREGRFHRVEEMETRHLFYVLRMIWNHCAPSDGKLLPYKKYLFTPFYTAVYMRQAVIEIYRELSGRTNLTASWKRELEFIANYVKELREWKKLT